MTVGLTGEVIGKYRLLEQVGATGMASLYRAEDTEQGGEVALKVLRPFFSTEETAVRRLLDEVARVRQLDHPNILSFVDASWTSAGGWLAAHYVTWPTLRQYLRQPVSLAAALAILEQVAAALDYAHREGIYHRDLKPGNVFINPEDGRVLVGDFGMALVTEGIDSLVKSSLTTPLASYTAPEQAQGLATDARSDVYSLGALAYHMLTGIMPFFALSPHTVLAKQLYSAPIPPSELNPQLPLLADGVLLQALARQPQARHASAGAVVEALRHALQDVDVQQIETQPLQAGTDATDRPLSTPTPSVVQDPAQGTLVCPLCSHVNEPAATRCVSCWANLTQQETVDKPEEQLRVQRHRRRVLRERLLRWGVTALVLGGIGTFAFLQVVDVGAPPAAVAAEIAAPVAEDTWALARRDFQNSGFAGATATVGVNRVKWTFKTDAPLFAAPAVVGDRVYLATGDWRLVALDRGTGELLWEYHTTGPIRSTPAVAGELVYFGLLDGRVLAVDRENGTLQWQFFTENPVFGAALVKDGTVYIGSGDKKVYALDAVTGERRWSWETKSWIVSAPAFARDDILVVGSQDGHAFFLDTDTGRKRLTFKMTTGIFGSPVALGNTVVVVSHQGSIVAIDSTEIEYPGERGWRRFRNQLWIWNMLPNPIPRDGTIWEVRIRDNVRTTPAIAYDTLYITTHEGQLAALDMDTGALRWRVDLDDEAPASPIVAGEYVLVGNSSGLLQAFDAASGELRWEHVTGSAISASPAVAGDELYVATQDGTLYVLQP